MYIKSPLNYTGGKYKILKPVLGAFPRQIGSFVDLFAGGFNVGINVEADRIFCNDQITYLIGMFGLFRETETEVLLTRIRGLIAAYQLTQQNKEGYLELRRHYNESKDLTELFVLTCYAFNHQIRFNNSHEFNSPFWDEQGAPSMGISRKNLTAFCRALKEKDIVFSTTDFRRWIWDSWEKVDLIYCDPPYLISTGSYNDGNRGFRDWHEEEEAALLGLLDRLNGQGTRFALSNVLYHKGTLQRSSHRMEPKLPYHLHR